LHHQAVGPDIKYYENTVKRVTQDTDLKDTQDSGYTPLKDIQDALLGGEQQDTILKDTEDTY
jgi:hypothetical protein